ncbi:MAG: RNB domain-containing ribonuclease [Gemmatimonadaceae bacterium]
MTTATPRGFDLRAAAARAAAERGFETELRADANLQLAAIAASPHFAPTDGVRDLRALPWSSIDDARTRDLDQVEVVESLGNGRALVRVAIADVDALVAASSPLDRHASVNGTSLYTGVMTFPMLPERLSTDLTSLSEGTDRLAVVIEYSVTADGSVSPGTVFRAWVRNQAKLAYDSVGAWLEGTAPPPPAVAASPVLTQQLRLQHDIASVLRTQRHRHGALELETIEARPVSKDGAIIDLELTKKSPARDLIEDFMIAANVVTAHVLATAGVPAIRRVVRVPERWPRLVELAQRMGVTLPATADAKALANFLSGRRTADPDHFADLSLAVVKMLGPGEYVVQRPGDPPLGHFGLAVQDYTHATAPNRRYADLVTQRLLKAAIGHAPSPYTADALTAIAEHCTLKENDARAVERKVRKQAAADLMASRIGDAGDAIITGVTPKGTFARLAAPPVEGIVVNPHRGLDVGDKVRVRIVSADIAKGYIDFRLDDGPATHPVS